MNVKRFIVEYYTPGSRIHPKSRPMKRLDFPKKPQPDFGQSSDQLLEYCLHDTLLTQRLWDHLMVEQSPMPAVRVEMRFAEVVHQMTRHGICFDSVEASQLCTSLKGRRQTVLDKLQGKFPPTIRQMKTPEYWTLAVTTAQLQQCEQPTQHRTRSEADNYRKRLGLKPRDVCIDPGPLKQVVVPFNPDSPKNVVTALRERYGWQPLQSDKGNPIVDEATLKTLPYPEAKEILEYRELTGHLQKLADGPHSWLKHSKSGRIHHHVNTCGSIAARCSHSGPNLAQVPSGPEFRRLFKPSEGRVLVGVDLAGIEARALAHYLHKYDDGDFAQRLLTSDIHEYNRQAAGLETRSQAKRLLYAFLYGGGASCIGDIIGGGPAEGRALIHRWMQSLPALQLLKSAVQIRWQANGWITAIDGRRIRPRKAHTALNALLQSCAAICAKLWAVIAADELRDTAQLLLHIHDETQWETAPEQSDEVTRIVVWAATEAGRRLKLHVPVDASSRVGCNWSETH